MEMTQVSTFSITETLIIILSEGVERELFLANLTRKITFTTVLLEEESSFALSEDAAQETA